MTKEKVLAQRENFLRWARLHRRLKNTAETYAVLDEWIAKGELIVAALMGKEVAVGAVYDKAVADEMDVLAWTKAHLAAQENAEYIKRLNERIEGHEIIIAALRVAGRRAD